MRATNVDECKQVNLAASLTFEVVVNHACSPAAYGLCAVVTANLNEPRFQM